jgi:hypothetical protein
MKTSSRWRVTTLDLAKLTVFVACALAISRIPEVWAALNTPNIGKPAAIVRYVVFWAGLLLVDLLVRAPERRFVGFGCVFLAVLIAPVFGSQTQLGLEPDWPGFGQTFLVLGAVSMFIVAAWIRMFAPR